MFRKILINSKMFGEVEITTTQVGDEYFDDTERIGSSEYAKYKESPHCLAYSALKPEGETSSMLFGKLFHEFLSGEKKLEDFSPDEKMKTSTPTKVAKGIIGSTDFMKLKIILEHFPIALSDIEKGCDFFYLEKGIHLDLNLNPDLKLKLRIKPDLAFKRLFEYEATILDWKTTASFFKSKDVYRLAQAEFYATLYGLCSGEKRVTFATWEINTLSLGHRVEGLVTLTTEEQLECLDMIISDCLEIQKIKKNPEDFLYPTVSCTDKDFFGLKEFFKPQVTQLVSDF